MIFDNLDALVPFARARAQIGVYDGRGTLANQRLIAYCTHHYRNLREGRSASVIYTRDMGHHSGGWWKNPDYEYCLHLSLANADPETGAPAPRDEKFFEQIAVAFFGDDARKAWIEGPYSPEGRAKDVWHYRVFCDQGWSPILPRGEVYARELTEAGWRSFSEIHGTDEAEVDAPFLKEGL